MFFIFGIFKVLAITSVGELLGVGVGENEFDGVGEGEEFGVGETAGMAAAIAMPLLHTNFLPFFTQVKVLPDVTCFFPAFVQTAPVFGAAADDECNEIGIMSVKIKRTGRKRHDFIPRG